MQITILGAGAFGQALGKILRDNRHSISFFDPLVYPSLSLTQSTTHAKTIIVAIPTSLLPKFLANYPEKLKKLPTILTSKGLQNPSLFTDFPNFSVLAGPAFARDILSGAPTVFTASSLFAKQLFENAQISIELCDDVLGILLCSSLKNIYAIGAGYLSATTQANLSRFIATAHAELSAFLADHGARRTTANYACGIGDLRLTCTSPNSRNFRCGVLLARQKPLHAIKQALPTLEGLSALQQIDVKNYPILNKIHLLVKNARP